MPYFFFCISCEKAHKVSCDVKTVLVPTSVSYQETHLFRRGMDSCSWHQNMPKKSYVNWIFLNAKPFLFCEIKTWDVRV